MAPKACADDAQRQPLSLVAANRGNQTQGTKDANANVCNPAWHPRFSLCRNIKKVQLLLRKAAKENDFAAGHSVDDCLLVSLASYDHMLSGWN